MISLAKKQSNKKTDACILHKNFLSFIDRDIKRVMLVGIN